MRSVRKVAGLVLVLLALNSLFWGALMVSDGLAVRGLVAMSSAVAPACLLVYLSRSGRQGKHAA